MLLSCYAAAVIFLARNGVSKDEIKKYIIKTFASDDPKADNYEERVRRHALYQRVGLVDLPRQLTEARVVYDLMGVGGEILPEEYQELMDHHMGSRMRKALDMRLIEN